MNNCVNSIGFMFNSAKTYIKKDKNKKNSSSYCQECVYKKKHCRKCDDDNKYQEIQFLAL